MKKIVFLILSFTFCLNISGQQINQSNNRYRGNDVLEKKQVNVQGFDLNSNKGVWSLEEAKLSEDSYNAEYSTETDDFDFAAPYGDDPRDQMWIKRGYKY